MILKTMTVKIISVQDSIKSKNSKKTKKNMCKLKRKGDLKVNSSD